LGIPRYTVLDQLRDFATWGIVVRGHSNNTQGIPGMDCRIAQTGLQSNLVDWIVIDNPKLK